MKLNWIDSSAPASANPELVRTFGSAELLRHPAGRWELRGGTPRDRLEAREWISLFCHEAVLPSDPKPVGGLSVVCAARPCRHAQVALWN